jgi:hypothetical protein
MHTDGNSLCRGLASASSSDDVEPLKGPFVCSWARLLDARLSSHLISCPAGMAWCSSLLKPSVLHCRPGVLPCSGSVVGDPSVVTGWRSRLTAELFLSDERSCDYERW